MTDRPRRVAMIGAAVLAVALGGCSSSGGGDSSSTPARTVGGTSSSAAETAKPASAAVTSAVSHAFAVFFGSTSTAAQSQAVLQHGASFVKALADEAKSSYADKSSAKVTRVSLVSADVADVTFTILNGTSPVLSNTKGKAVREGGTWKVAAATFCGLLQLEGTAPAQCKDTEIIGLPD